MAATKNDVSLTTAWQDLASVYVELNASPAVVQCKGPDECLIFWGGDNAPSGKNGMILGRADPSYGTATKIWVRALRSKSVVSCGTLDEAL